MTTWRRPPARASAASATALSLRFSKLREVLERQHTNLEMRPTGGNLDFIVDNNINGARLQRANDLRSETSGDDHRTVGIAVYRDGDTDRQGEIASRDSEPITSDCQVSTRQHRKRTTASRNSPPGDPQRIGKGIAFTPELHRTLLSAVVLYMGFKLW